MGSICSGVVKAVPQRTLSAARLPAARSGAALERLSSLIDWQPICALLAPLYPSAKGEPAWPPRPVQFEVSIVL